MVIIYGSRLYGKVDVVPGLFHVETRFGHLYYFPLIPIESFAVFSKSGDQINGVKIPMSFKSILYAWLRAGMLVASIFSLLMVVILWGSDPSSLITAGIIAASSLATWALLSFHKGSTHASLPPGDADRREDRSDSGRGRVHRAALQREVGAAGRSVRPRNDRTLQRRPLIDPQARGTSTERIRSVNRSSAP